MTLKHATRLGALASALVFISVAATARAADEPARWDAMDMRVTYTGSAVRMSELDVANAAEALYSVAPGHAGTVAFTCLKGELSVAVSLKPVSMRDMLLNPPDSSRHKLIRPKFTAGGKRMSVEDWIYMPAMSVARARRNSSVRQLYNAAVRGLPVVMSHRGDRVAVVLPPVDADFRDFGAACGLGRKASAGG